MTPIPPPVFKLVKNQLLELIGTCSKYTLKKAKNRKASIPGILSEERMAQYAKLLPKFIHFFPAS